MGFWLLIFLLPILALIAQRDDFKRIVAIAVTLEAVKVFFIILISPMRNEFFNFLFAIVVLIVTLPERMIGGEPGSQTLGSRMVVLCAGAVWNLAPAYFISLLLPDRQRTRIVIQ